MAIQTHGDKGMVYSDISVFSLVWINFSQLALIFTLLHVDIELFVPLHQAGEMR